MKIVNMREAKTHLSRLVEAVTADARVAACGGPVLKV